jgi:glycine/D-amino acid oxidase-like deaminating enzyme
MKRVVESVGVEVKERTVVTRITPGKENLVDTELGEIRSPILIIALNAYAHKLGFFKNRVFPISVFQIATEPLSGDQWASIGWQNRQGLSDLRALFSYSVPTADGRIIMGGSDFTYYGNDALSSGNDKTVTHRIEENLFEFFPQLDGLRIEHAWGGTTAYTLGRVPSIGVMGDHQNIYYGIGFDEGVPSTQTAGRIIADLLAGESNEFTSHFTVNRKLRYAGPTTLRGVFAKGVKWLMEKYEYSPIH